MYHGGEKKKKKKKMPDTYRRAERPGEQIIAYFKELIAILEPKSNIIPVGFPSAPPRMMVRAGSYTLLTESWFWIPGIWSFQLSSGFWGADQLRPWGCAMAPRSLRIRHQHRMAPCQAVQCLPGPLLTLSPYRSDSFSLTCKVCLKLTSLCT